MEDKVTIVLTPQANRVAEEVLETGFFQDKMDVAKFAFAYAIKEKLDSKELSVDISGRGASWNIGSFDNDRFLYDLIRLLYPGTPAPYRQIEKIVNLGLLKVKDYLEQNPSSLPHQLMLSNNSTDVD